MEWFKDLKLEEYCNIIKYEKINGKDILEGDKSFFYNIMGTISDHYQKIKYEISKVKNKKLINQKLFGWGSNQFGQLTIENNDSFIRKPTPISLNILTGSKQINSDLKNENDYISKIYCGKTCSFLQTNFGEIYFAGNIFPENPLNTIIKPKDDKDYKNDKDNKEKDIKDKDKKKKNEKDKDKKAKKNDSRNQRTNSNLSEKDKSLSKALNKWVNVSYLISYDKKTFEFFRVKQIYLNSRNEIIFLGYQSTFVPFVRQDKKAKFKECNQEEENENVNIDSIGSVKKGLTEKFCTIQDLLEKINKKSLGDELGYTLVYENPMYGILENLVADFLLSDVPFHKVLQLKFYGEVVWDRKLRYIKHEYNN